MIRSIGDILASRRGGTAPKNIAHEFQDFGVRLAEVLNDRKRKSFYIKLAKETDRGVLERARDFALGYHKAKSKAKVFMWFLKELRDAKSEI